MLEKEKSINTIADINEPIIKSFNPIDLSEDSDFEELNELYQHAELGKCNEVLTILEKRYPGNPTLLKFRDDLQMKLSLKTMAARNRKDQTHNTRKITLKMSVFAVIATLLVMTVYFVAYNFISTNLRAKRLEQETTQLTSLNNQAEQLILAGQPRPAAEIIASIALINPEYTNLPELTAKTEALLRLDMNYRTALNLMVENKKSEALVMLKEIEAEKPGLWDVSQQITSIETSIQIAKHMQEGNAAYEISNWDQVISSYETVLTIAPKLDDQVMKGQLLKAYLSKIIGMLQNESTTVEEIENAEQFYRRAVAMIPQSKDFASERGNLEEVSSDLLVLKFTQSAKAILEDKNQTVNTIADAVTFMSKAANLRPKNTALQTDLKNAEYYQIGFQNFVEMNWVFAISNLKQIISVDANYANGNASTLLFEAYYALGKQYYSVELYQDARKNLEQAEILAWADTGNLMKLFQVQLQLGDMFGKMRDYKNAVTYYKYALDAVQVYTRLGTNPNLYWQLKEAENWALIGVYDTAFPLYQEALKEIAVIYTMTDVEIISDVCLAFFASENSSIVDVLIEANNLPKSMVITYGRTLKVPSIKK